MRIVFTLGFAVTSASAWAAMPATEQNALVKKYCAVCHTDSANNGGLSLEHFDAARRDPGLAAMMLSKLNNGAMGAAGNGVPDKAAQKAWLESTREQAAQAREWFVTHERGVVSAGIVREVAPRNPGGTDAPVYRVRLVCNFSTGFGEMQLTWSPQPQMERTMTASVDGNAPVEYRIEGTDRASVVLMSGRSGKLALPKQSLSIRDLFPGETVEFPFEDLEKKARSELSKCF